VLLPALLALAQAFPTVDGDTGLVHLPTAYVLRPGQGSLGFFRDNLDRSAKDLDVSDHGVSIAAGAGRGLEAFARFVLQRRVDADALEDTSFAPEAPFVRQSWTTGLGDATLGAKLQLLDDRGGDHPVALAVRGTLVLPTAPRELSTGRPAAGAQLVVSSTRGRTGVHGAFGFSLHADPSGANVPNRFLLGAGVASDPAPWLSLQAEMTAVGHSGGEVSWRAPVEVTGAIGLRSRRGLFVRAALSHNLTFEGPPGATYRSSTGILASVGLHRGVEPPRVRPAVNAPPVVTCHAERTHIEAGEVIGLAALAWDAEGDALAYRWSSTRGEVDGTSPASSLHVDTGGRVRATVTVTDARGAATEAHCDILVEP
jgi:hypothetical protein